jgi:hypothetical protein
MYSRIYLSVFAHRPDLLMILQGYCMGKEALAQGLLGYGNVRLIGQCGIYSGLDRSAGE